MACGIFLLKLVTSHLHSLQKLQVWLGLVLAQRNVYYRGTSWWVMNVGRKRQQSFGSTLHTMEPPSCALFQGFINSFIFETGKLPGSDVLCCSLHQQSHLLGCAGLVLSQSGNVQYQKFRIIAEKCDHSGSRSAGGSTAAFDLIFVMSSSNCPNTRSLPSASWEDEPWEETFWHWMFWNKKKKVCMTRSWPHGFRLGGHWIIAAA